MLSKKGEHKDVLAVTINPAVYKELDTLTNGLLSRSQLVEWAIVRFIDEVNRGELRSLLPGLRFSGQAPEAATAVQSTSSSSEKETTTLPKEVPIDNAVVK